MAPRRALVLLVVGLLLLPGPVYALGMERLDGSDRHRVAAGYTATPIDIDDDGLLTEKYRGDLTFRTESLAYRHVAADYREPNRTKATLERAIRTGNATTTDERVRADLRRAAERHPFVTVEYDRVYDYTVETRGGETTVETTPASDELVARTVRERLVVPYDTLSPAERETFRKIRAATTDDDPGDYRPWSDEPVPEQPVVARNGTHYAVEVVSHTDDVGPPDGVIAGVGASLLGVCLVVGSGGWLVYGRLRD